MRARGGQARIWGDERQPEGARLASSVLHLTLSLALGSRHHIAKGLRRTPDLHFLRKASFILSPPPLGRGDHAHPQIPRSIRITNEYVQRAQQPDRGAYYRYILHQIAKTHRS